MAGKFNIVSLFSGAGGLDTWFHQAGFSTVWANENNLTAWNTFQANFPNAQLDRRDVREILGSEVPDCVWIIGWPPCQSRSVAGSGRGIEDARWRLFHEYIRLLKSKKPLFFLAENVAWMLASKHEDAFSKLIESLENLGYDVSHKLLNAHDYGIPQDRKRVFLVGYRHELWMKFNFPKACQDKLYLKDAIGDLPESIPNHEYMAGWFSSRYLSRNRVRGRSEPSFAIQASGRHAPLHPQAPKMIKLHSNRWIFEPWKEHLYRRLSVRECARIQTFSDDFAFYYDNIADGYRMVGNAVPVKLSKILAEQIHQDFSAYYWK